jgi:hypothetical protein
MGKRNRNPEDVPAGLVAALVASFNAPVALRRREVDRVRILLAAIDLQDESLLKNIATSVMVESTR